MHSVCYTTDTWHKTTQHPFGPTPSSYRVTAKKNQSCLSPCCLLRQNCSTHTLGPNQLTKELTSCSKLLTTAQKYSVLLATTDTSSDSTTSAAPPQTPKRHKWFRPQGGLPSPCVVETAEKLGYCTVLASVFPWDNYSGWPLLNACYVWSKVYPGAVVMLNEG